MLHGLVSPTRMRPSIALLLSRQVRATWPNLVKIKMFVQPNQNNRVNISPNQSWLLFQILMLCVLGRGSIISWLLIIIVPIEYNSLGSFQISYVLSTVYKYFSSLGIGRIDSNQIGYIPVPLSTRAISGIRCLSWGISRGRWGQNCLAPFYREDSRCPSLQPTKSAWKICNLRFIVACLL